LHLVSELFASCSFWCPFLYITPLSFLLRFSSFPCVWPQHMRDYKNSTSEQYRRFSFWCYFLTPLFILLRLSSFPCRWPRHMRYYKKARARNSQRFVFLNPIFITPLSSLLPISSFLCDWPQHMRDYKKARASNTIALDVFLFDVPFYNTTLHSLSCSGSQNYLVLVLY
jgi:hypothetical protein